MNIRAKALSNVVCILLLSGCANPPLMFASGVTVGVDIGINGASTNPINLTVGYKQLDGTLVPVTASATGATVYPIRGCSGSAVGSASAAGCTPTSAGHVSSANATGSSAVHMANAQAEAIQPVSLGLQPITTGAVTLFGSPTPQLPGDNRNEVESSTDALSVYSSFDAKVTATSGQAANAGVFFGKVFATGVAAQSLADAQKLFATYKGQALIYGPSAICLGNLAAVLNAGGKSTSATVDMIKVCAPPPPPAPDK